jgi:hypothetical protein
METQERLSLSCSRRDWRLQVLMVRVVAWTDVVFGFSH